MPSQLPCAEPRADARIVPLRGQHELTRILALTKAAPEAPAWPATAWQSFLEQDEPEGEPRRLLLAAMAPDGSLSGVVAVTLSEVTAELELLLVAPVYRRQGLGRALSRAWLQWAQRAGAREAVLEVRASNNAAQRLYLELGFEPEGRRPHYYHHPEEDAVLMRRSIAQNAVPEHIP